MFIIKHNYIIRKIYVLFGSLFLRFVGFFIPIEKNLILLVSNGGNNYTGSIRSIYEYIKDDSYYDKYKIVFAFTNPEKYIYLKEKIVKFDSLEYFITALKAEYWITDNNVERNLRFKKKDTKYLNTWHGIALKKIGNDHRDSGHYDYSNIDYLCVSGEYDEKVFASALNAGNKSYLRCGMPRNDSLYFADEKQKLKIREKLHIPINKKIILYAPTWRESQNRGKTYDFLFPVDLKKWENELENDYVLLFRAHDRTTNLLNLEFNDFLRNVNGYEPLNELMIASDLLITDYSSIAFDYSILRKPILFFCFDYDEYRRERGFYFEPQDVFRQSILQTEDDVLRAIKTLDYNEESIKTGYIFDQFIQYGRNGNSTEVCVSTLLGRGK